ncbi:hypothetical protein BaRGS_00002366 [Batillaria attramentaria]|uniref:Uncharacterized protein n=1 Tax=Batillaria attramentaria TaxID=370345 RepID=A0ABD0M2X3_9CAEN
MIILTDPKTLTSFAHGISCSANVNTDEQTTPQKLLEVKNSKDAENILAMKPVKESSKRSATSLTATLTFQNSSAKLLGGNCGNYGEEVPVFLSDEKTWTDKPLTTQHPLCSAADGPKEATVCLQRAGSEVK